MITILLVFIVAIVFLSSKLRRKLQCDVPGPKPYPILGNALEFLAEDPLFVLERLRKEFNLIFRAWLGPDLYIVLMDPVDVEVILSSHKHTVKATVYRFMKEWMGDGLINSHGEKWSSHRKFLTPTFHFKILENSLEIMHNHVRSFVEQLEPEVGRSEFDVHPYVEKMSLDVISEVAMDVRVYSQTSIDNSYLHAVKSVTEISVGRMFKVWLQSDIIFRLSSRYNEYQKSLQIIRDVAQNVIKTKRKKMEECNSDSIREEVSSDDSSMSKKARSPFLDAMLRESTFTDEDIYEEVLAIMFAGHDTTTTSTSFCLHQISNHPDIQEKVYQEIMSFMPHTDQPTIQDLNKMKYTENVIKESLRLYPPAPMIARSIFEDIKLPSGYTIPANSSVIAYMYGMHRDPKYFPEPEKFMPERFESSHQRHPFSYIPFSAGPRNCIGQKLAMMEMKVTIVNLLRKYKLLPAEKMKSLDLAMGVILRSKNGLPVRIVKREESESN